MKARILTSLLVLGSSVFLLANCSSSDAPVNPPAGGSNNGVAGSAAGTPGSTGGSAPAGGGSGPVGAGGSAGTAVATGGSGPSGGSGVGGSAVGGSTSNGGSGGASASGAGGKASGGGSSGGAVGTGGGGSFALTSDKIAAGVKMPTEFTCANKANPPSPPFAWTAGPTGTMSYALIMFDPDAPNGGYTHWIVWDIPASTTMLPAALGSMATLTMPAGAKQKAGSGMGYLGPCPPSNATHNYKFTLYALDVATLPGVMTSSTTAALTTAIEMHDIASAVMIVPSDGK